MELMFGKQKESYVGWGITLNEYSHNKPISNAHFRALTAVSESSKDKWCAAAREGFSLFSASNVA